MEINDVSRNCQNRLSSVIICEYANIPSEAKNAARKHANAALSIPESFWVLGFLFCILPANPCSTSSTRRCVFCYC